MAFSVVIPCFNNASTIERAIRSCLQQTGLSEVVVVDDCSQDESLNIVAKLACGNEKIRLCKMDHNSGPAAARNRGFSQTSGSHLCFLDADDEFVGDYFSVAGQIFSSEPELHAIKCDIDFFDPVKGYILPDYDVRYASVVLSSANGLVLSRSAFERLGGFPENNIFRGANGGEDVAFMQALMKYFQPIRKVGEKFLRIWSRAGSHHDRFLSNTRVCGNTFEFVKLDPDQLPGGGLEVAINEYLNQIAEKF